MRRHSSSVLFHRNTHLVGFGGNAFALDVWVDDIGASLDSLERGFDIPLTLQRVDLGVIQPGEVLDPKISRCPNVGQRRTSC